MGLCTGGEGEGGEEEEEEEGEGFGRRVTKAGKVQGATATGRGRVPGEKVAVTGCKGEEMGKGRERGMQEGES